MEQDESYGWSDRHPVAIDQIRVRNSCYCKLLLATKLLSSHLREKGETTSDTALTD